jgi:hypothetical protein
MVWQSVGEWLAANPWAWKAGVALGVLAYLGVGMGLASAFLVKACLTPKNEDQAFGGCLLWLVYVVLWPACYLAEVVYAWQTRTPPGPPRED